MKKVLLSVMASLPLLLVPATSFANSNNGYGGDTVVTGTVHHHDGKHHDKDDKVTVSCDGHNKTAWADSNGNYQVKFSHQECKDKDWINVRSDDHYEHGHNYGRSDGKGHCHVDVDDGPPVTEVPEFGTLATVGAGLSGIGGFLVIRRRQLSGHQN